MEDFTLLVQKHVADKLAEPGTDGKAKVFRVLSHGHVAGSSMAAAVDVELAQVRKKMLSISTVVNASSIIGRGSLIGVQLIDNLSKASNQQVFVDTDTAANTARVQEAADALLDSCILDISSVLKQKEQHYQQVEAQEPHAHGKSASSMPDKGGVNKEDERWRYQVIAPDMIQFNMCVMAILLSRELVKMDSLMCKLTPVLAGQYWLWDNNTASWIRPDDLAVVADEAHLVEFYRCIFKVPVISLFEAYNLNYVSDKKQPAAPAGQMLLQMYNRLHVPCASELVVEVQCYDKSTLFNLSRGSELLCDLLAKARSWAPRTYPESRAAIIIDSLLQRLPKVVVLTASDLMVSYKVDLKGAPEAHHREIRYASWDSTAAPNGTTKLLLRNLCGLNRSPRFTNMVTDICDELAKIALEGGKCTAADMRSLAVELQPLVRDQLLQMQGLAAVPTEPAWQSFNNELIQASKTVTFRVGDDINYTLRDYLVTEQAVLSRTPGMSAKFVTGGFHVIKNPDETDPCPVLDARADPGLLFRNLLHKAIRAFGVLLLVNSTSDMTPTSLYQGLPRDQVGFIGELAVSIVLTVLTIQFRFTIEFVEDLRRSGEHFDILARSPDDELYYFEVKATRRPFDDALAHTFDLKPLEERHAGLTKAKYVLVRVYGVRVLLANGTFTPSDLRMLFMGNPMELKDAGLISIENKQAAKPEETGREAAKPETAKEVHVKRLVDKLT